MVAAGDQETILELLCNLLSPIGQHRSLHITPSKGKRSKRHARKPSTPSTHESSQDVTSRQATDKQAPNAVAAAPALAPPISSHVTVGFNSTFRRLQESSRHTAPSTLNTSLTDDRPSMPSLAAIFVLGPYNPSFHAHLPVLCTTSLVVLVHLAPLTAASRVCESLKQPRAGLVGVFENAPHARPLLDFVKQHVPLVEVPWLEEAKAGAYLPLNIRTDVTDVREEGADQVKLRGPRKRTRKRN